MCSSNLGKLTALVVAFGLLVTTLEAGGSASGQEPSAYSPAGKVFMTRDEALALAFPKCEVVRTTSYLSEQEQQAVAKLAGVEFESAVVYPYVAKQGGKLVGTAYFDTHRVRTLRETLMIVVAPDKSIKRIELLSFAEPRDYIPRTTWYAQFPGRKLDAELQLKRKIKAVTGATLTAKATTSSARRMLALHQELANIAKRKADAERKQKAPEAREVIAE